MSSPFQKAFMGKDPIKTIKLSDKDLKGKKSASSRPAKEISYEGQGGKDYENRPEDAINPEGQGGIDYEAKPKRNIISEGFGASEYIGSVLPSINALNNRKAKTITLPEVDLGTVKNDKKKTSPLDSYSNPGQVKYFSNKQDFKALQDKIVQSTDAETKAENQEARVNRRDERRGKKGNFTQKSLAEFDAKTNIISSRASDNRNIAAKKRKCPPGQTYDPILGCTP